MTIECDTAACPNVIPDDAPVYPADMYGNGRLCETCESFGRLPGQPWDHVPCTICPHQPLFRANYIPDELAEHQHLAHGIPMPPDDLRDGSEDR
jgi:hypothetical protein